MGPLKLLSRSASWAWSWGCSWFFLVLPVYSGLGSFARGDCRGITVFTHTGPVWVTIWHFLWREALQSSSSGLFSDNSDSPLGPLNDTSLFLHCELVHRQFLFSSTFPLLVQGVYDHEIGCWAVFCFSRYTSWLLANCVWLECVEHKRKPDFSSRTLPFNFDVANPTNTSVCFPTNVVIFDINSLSLDLLLWVAVRWKELTIKFCQVNIMWAAREERKCFQKVIFIACVCLHIWYANICEARIANIESRKKKPKSFQLEGAAPHQIFIESPSREDLKGPQLSQYALVCINKRRFNGD